jgi:LysM repeat protein
MTVQPGDTLWGIAQRAAPDADPRVTVARIMEMNSLHSSTVPAGSALFVPTSG